MNRAPFTLEIHPRAWYALANLPKEAYERIQQGLTVVADNAANHVRSAKPSAPGAEHGLQGTFETLDGYRARYELQPARRCLCVLAVERPGEWRPGPISPAPSTLGGAAPARNALVGAAPALEPDPLRHASASPERGPGSSPEEA